MLSQAKRYSQPKLVQVERYGYNGQMDNRLSPVLGVAGLVLAGAIFLLACGSASDSGGSADDIGLGDLPGDNFSSRALALSGDGTTVVGQSRSASGPEAFRWTAAAGMEGLGDLAGGKFDSVATAVSADGLVVVGTGFIEVSGTGSNDINARQAFLWKSTSGVLEDLGDFDQGNLASEASGLAVAASGVVRVVGHGSIKYQPVGGGSVAVRRAARWVRRPAGNHDLQDLGDLPDDEDPHSEGLAISANGAVVVGSSFSASGLEAFRWQIIGGCTSDGIDASPPPCMVGLDDLAGGEFGSQALDISQDGSAIVGYGTSASGREAFRWTSLGGMVGLGDLPGGSFHSEAAGASTGGSVVVGFGNSASGPAAFIWDATNGMRELAVVLAGLGFDLTGWTLTKASAVSDDGKVIVGHGTNPDGNQEAWRVVIP